MKKESFKVMILAAGLGTRLRPITDKIPKVMVPIAKGLPLLEHLIIHLRSQGFSDFVINLYYLPEIITGYFGDGSRFEVNINYSDESGALMGTGGSIQKAKNLLSDNFLFLYGDLLHFFQFQPLINMHKDKKALITATVIKEGRQPAQGDIVEVDFKSQKIISWHPRPHNISDFGKNLFLNGGIYMISKSILDFIAQDKPVNLDKDVIAGLVDNGADIYGHMSECEILDIGTPDLLERGREWFAGKNQARKNSA